MNKEHIIQQDIILDTCILQYLGNKNLQEDLDTYLRELISRGFLLTISEISIAELLTNLNKHSKSMLYLQLLSPNINLINEVFNMRK